MDRRFFLVKSQKGFGLIETLLAAGILIMTLAGTITLVNLAIRQSIISANRAMAYNLAREAQEVVRQTRDTELLKNPSNGWNGWANTTGQTEIVFKSNKWQFYWSPGEKSNDDNDSNAEVIYLLTNNGAIIDNSSTTKAKNFQQDVPYVRFARQILVESPSDTSVPTINKEAGGSVDVSDNFRKITVTVSWTDYGKSYSVQSVTYLTNLGIT